MKKEKHKNKQNNIKNLNLDKSSDKKMIFMYQIISMFFKKITFRLSSKWEYIIVGIVKQFWGVKMRVVLCICLIATVLVTEAYSTIRTMSNRKKAYTELTSGVSRVKLTRDPEVSSEIRLVTFGFSSYSPSNVTDAGSDLTSGNKFFQNENVEPAVTDVLNYPNPFRLLEGSTLKYKLSKNMNIEILIYDMMSNLIQSQEYEAGSPGGLKGSNRLIINSESFESFDLSAGIYFYYIRHNGVLMAKGKFAIVP